MSRELVASVHVGGRFFAAGESPPKEFADQITNPNAWGEGDSGGGDPDGDSTGYGSMRKVDLEAEVELRNEGRGDDDRIVVEGKGNVPDLVAALESDDTAAGDDPAE